jgi:tRNA threonylcarbamoyladenosine biosynthesis protein TsaE
MATITINTIKEIHKAAQQFIQLIGNQTIFAFHGEMGAGKTTFIRAVCEEMGVDENISSPTFAIVNEYFTPDGKKIFHFDCYRLKDMREAYEIGAEDYFYSGELCFIEWPEKIEELLPETTVNVFIKVLDSGGRLITI